MKNIFKGPFNNLPGEENPLTPEEIASANVQKDYTESEAKTAEIKLACSTICKKEEFRLEKLKNFGDFSSLSQEERQILIEAIEKEGLPKVLGLEKRYLDEEDNNRLTRIIDSLYETLERLKGF